MVDYDFVYNEDRKSGTSVTIGVGLRSLDSTLGYYSVCIRYGLALFTYIRGLFTMGTPLPRGFLGRNELGIGDIVIRSDNRRLADLDPGKLNNLRSAVSDAFSRRRDVIPSLLLTEVEI